MAIEFFFSILWISLMLTGHLTSSINLSIFLILAGWWSTECKYITQHHLKHSLLSKFWIIIKPFFGWFNSFGNFGTTVAS